MNSEDIFFNIGTVIAIILVLLPISWKFSSQLQRLSDNIQTLFKMQNKTEGEIKVIDDRTRKTDIHIAEINLSMKHIEKLIEQHISDGK